jgi:DNA-binding transcriptional LysR family regulator
MSLRGLPPLDLLVPFEASARLGSFTRAAAELSVTQSAVSQRVRRLEEVLGTVLFERHHRRIALTGEGQELYNGVKVALQHLSAATGNISRPEDRPVVRLAVDTSIGGLWLLPRLSGYLQREDRPVLHLSVSDDPDVLLDADVSVLHGDGTWPGFETTLLFPDEVFPVCAPGYLEQHPIESLSDLVRADLIDLDYKQWHWMTWGIWLTEAGVEANDANVVICTNDYLTMINVARAGLGVALGWRHFVDEDLRAGRLVCPVDARVRTQMGYYVAWRQGAQPLPRALAGYLSDSVELSQVPQGQGADL